MFFQQNLNIKKDNRLQGILSEKTGITWYFKGIK